MNKYSLAKLSVAALVGLSVVVGSYQLTVQSSTSKDKSIETEIVTCLSAICIDRSPGQQCLELNASITHLYVTEDANVIGAKRVVIETSSKQCGNSIFK